MSCFCCCCCCCFRLGAHYKTNGSVETEQDIHVAKIIMHESYQSPLHFSNDIALIYLASPADLGVGVGLVCLPDTTHDLPFNNTNQTCWITGWGSLYFWGPSPNALMQASVPLVSNQRCNNTYPGDIDDSMLCTGFDAGGVGPCHGDSGGPLVCDFNGTWYLEGATSWGYGCAEPNYYGVFANIRSLKPWLLTNMYTGVSPPAVSPQNQTSSALGKHNNLATDICVFCCFSSVKKQLNGVPGLSIEVFGTMIRVLRYWI